MKNWLHKYAEEDQEHFDLLKTKMEHLMDFGNLGGREYRVSKLAWSLAAYGTTADQSAEYTIKMLDKIIDIRDEIIKGLNSEETE